MAVHRVEIVPCMPGGQPATDREAVVRLSEAGLVGVRTVRKSRLFFLEGGLSEMDAAAAANRLLADPVTEQAVVLTEGTVVPDPEPPFQGFEIHPRPGVMDPVALSTQAELRAEGYGVDVVRTARRYCAAGGFDVDALLGCVGRALANDCIERVVAGAAPVEPQPEPPLCEFEFRHVSLVDLDDAALERLSRDGHLFLSRDEMRTVQQHFQRLGREPTDLELETLAQTWSEHCVHKTLKSAITYRGAAFPGRREEGVLPPVCGEETRHYENLLKDTIVRATFEVRASGRGPQCLSVFEDNAGVVAFDDQFGLAFKVETHNHPSAIEPYGGAATGIGGVIRDVIGCGLGAKPIANTDVFCVAPTDWPMDELPRGVLHPERVLRGVVQGVADYGNRMGIPTVNGCVLFEPRYLGNPLVFAGSLGLIPRNRVQKAAQPGDLVVVVGGRTGRDGIHGATFSSAELTDTHADEFSHAVQIGNAITEKRFLDALLQARDAEGGCLYSAITDCGAGGLSSAVGEMGEHVGAVVDLDRVPLKYAGLRYDEIWISEAQERMVVALPPENLERFAAIMAAEEVEATVIGTFGQRDSSSGKPRMMLRFSGQVVGDLEMEFLHNGVPGIERTATWTPRSQTESVVSDEAGADLSPGDVLARLRAELRRANTASKEWIIRRYDHEVQGASVIKPLQGPGRGPSDAAVLRPVLGSDRGVAVGCGIAPHLADDDPYWMAIASIDEAVRNVVCVGGDPAQTAILDNFCWGRSDDPAQLGALVRACQACYDAAVAYGVPFISGKDSLNNEFALDEADVDRLISSLTRRAQRGGTDAGRLRRLLPTLTERLRQHQRLSIPQTLLISALALVPDVRRCVTADLKSEGNTLVLVIGFPPLGFDLHHAATTHAIVAELIRDGHVRAAHDVSDGGWLVAAAEMAIAGRRGLEIDRTALGRLAPFAERCAAYVLEVADTAVVSGALDAAGVAHVCVASAIAELVVRLGDASCNVDELAVSWSGRA